MESEAREVLEALERSGETVAAFAAERGLDPQRIYYWRRRVAGGDPITFHELVVRPSPSAGQEVPFCRGWVMVIAERRIADARSLHGDEESTAA
jgi:hypothetical protein